MLYYVNEPYTERNGSIAPIVGEADRQRPWKSTRRSSTGRPRPTATDHGSGLKSPWSGPIKEGSHWMEWAS